MILQALTRYYDILRQDPDTLIPPPGYSSTGVSFALHLSEQGELLDVFPMFENVTRGKKTGEVPRRMEVPEQVKRSSAISPNFLCDNNAYILGLTDKDSSDPTFGKNRYDAFRRLNIELLQQADCPAARAVIAFLDRHDPAQIHHHPAIARHLDGLLKGGNLVFMVRGAFVHEDPAVREVWEKARAGKAAVFGQCLVTGEMGEIARLHPSLKRVRGAQPSGASLVSFNERAYESYNRSKGQGLNAPVSEKAVFKYATALNYLLSSDNPYPPILLGDTTVVYWAESEKKEYSAFFASIFGSGYTETADPTQEERNTAEKQLEDIAGKVQRADALDVSGLNPNVRFYVLGLAPNAARLSVRFFIMEPFGKIVTRILQHHEDLKIEKEFPNQHDHIPLWAVLGETVSKKAKDAHPAPLLAGAVMRAILTGAPYPAALFNALINRVRADMDDPQRRIYKINYVRAAAIKAFLIRKYRRQPQNQFKEVLDMSLNEQSTIPAYVLGRLFAVLEKVQQEAIGSMDASIKDRYFTSACATPGSVFPVLLRLSQHHIAKAKYGYTSDRRIQQLLDLLEIDNNPFPAHLTLDEQGVFILGYYHQRADFFKKKSEQPVEIPSSEGQLTHLPEEIES